MSDMNRPGLPAYTLVDLAVVVIFLFVGVVTTTVLWLFARAVLHTLQWL